MKLSVIVCTFNRAYALNPCLDSIAAALGSVDAEIIVVDNASTDTTAETVRSWAKSAAVPVNLVHEPKKGLAAARNCGLRHAKGGLICFTDDDCRMDIAYVQDLLRYAEADKGLVIRGGRIELGDTSDLPLTFKTDDTRARWSRDDPGREYEIMGGKAISGCNMVMSREVVERLGAFDERLGAGTNIPGGEDTDYYLRAYLSGIAIEYVPDMTIVHWHGRKTPLEANKLMRSYTLSNGALYAKYVLKVPSLCKEFYWDCKKAIRELVKGSNDFIPEWKFSYRDKVRYCVLGAGKYILAILQPSPR